MSLEKTRGLLSGNWHHKDPFKQFAKQDTPAGSIRVLQITEGRMRINMAHWYQEHVSKFVLSCRLLLLRINKVPASNT